MSLPLLFIKCSCFHQLLTNEGVGVDMVQSWLKCPWSHLPTSFWNPVANNWMLNHLIYSISCVISGSLLTEKNYRLLSIAKWVSVTANWVLFGCGDCSYLLNIYSHPHPQVKITQVTKFSCFSLVALFILFFSFSSQSKRKSRKLRNH
jgi:hypothetical protein